MTPSFKCGDRVALKNGGPVMAVTGASDDLNGQPKVWCSWFDDKHQHQTEGYAAEDLVAVELADLGPPP